MKIKSSLLLVIATVSLFSETVRGQNPNVGPNDIFAWDQQATTLNEAQGYVYKYYLDGATTGSVWSNVTCKGTASPFSCESKTPAFSPGQHQIQITAANSTGESGKSNPFAFVYGNPPQIPNNMRVVKAPPTK